MADAPDHTAAPGVDCALHSYRAYAHPPSIDPGDGRHAVFCPASGRVGVVDATDLNLLALCRTSFRPLDEHAARACIALGCSLNYVDSIRERLSALAAAGLLTSRTDVDALLARSAGGRGEGVLVIGIPTRDRPELLSRCLHSLAAARAATDHPVTVVVSDGSGDPQARAANRLALTCAGPGLNAAVFYSGPHERESFIAALIRHGADPTAAQYALRPDARFSFAGGTNRNVLSLFACGRVLLQLDDDTLSVVATPGQTDPGLALTSEYDPTGFWFPAPNRSAGQPADLAGVHEALLGRGVGDCAFATPGGRPALDSADAAFLARLRAAGGRIRVTTAGVAGDSGMGASSYFLYLRNESRSRLHATRATYTAALSGGPVLRSVTRPTITPGSVCMGLNLGLDLRSPLPPRSRPSSGTRTASSARSCGRVTPRRSWGTSRRPSGTCPPATGPTPRPPSTAGPTGRGQTRS